MSAKLPIASILRVAVLALLVMTVSGCDLIQGIFKVGFWAGIIIVAVILAIIWFIVRMLGGGRRRGCP